MSFGLFGTPKFTLENIATEFDISRERVRQIQGTALNKMKTLLTSNHSLLDD
jgi:DNA-directed RNA polymerase sigma subunit (sigma70/sigma32)